MSLTDKPQWARLLEQKEKLSHTHMRELFIADPKRFSRFSLRTGAILFDYSKNIINEKVIAELISLARECDLQNQIERMFNGEMINSSEARSVLHTALRNRGVCSVYVHGQDVMPDVANVLQKIRCFVNQIKSGSWTGHTGKPITDIVNIGIGGSDLGPAMTTHALKPYAQKNLRAHFVSNVDGTHITDVLQQVDFETTLFVVVSKTFTTQETLSNALTARQWLLDQCADGTAIAKHFVAVSSNQKQVSDFGIDPDNMFEFWDWVGGRFSLWSAVGLSLAIMIGMDRFEEMLEGGYEMDQHFRNAPFEQNMPVILALLGIWYRNFFACTSQVIAPYDQYLLRFPAYLQQLEMESNGKSVDRNGQQVTYPTCPVIWGEPGTNGQHAFFQLLHQGTDIIPVDFIVPRQSHHAIGDHHRLLLSNCLSQSEALMRGKTLAEATEELQAQGLNEERIDALVAYKTFAGNRPSNTLLLDIIDPKTLGSMIALYEHKVFVQGVIWGVNSFDQWGVELGKQLAKTVANELEAGLLVSSHDSSTNGLLNNVIKPG